MNQILHGDVLEQLATIDDESVDLIATDPPYGVLPGNVASKGYRNIAKTNKGHADWDKIDLIPFTTEWFNLAYSKLKPDSFMFCFWSQKFLREGLDIFSPKRMVMWRYNNLTLGGNGDFAYDYEPIFVIKKGNPKLIKGKWTCDLEYTKPQSNHKKDQAIHPTQKPLALMEHLVHIATQPGNVVLDPFGGSGTTAVAAKKLGRTYITIEKSDEYIQLITDRLSNTIITPATEDEQ